MRRLNPLGALLIAVIAISAVQAAYVLAGSEPSPRASTLSSAALALAFILWIDSDARSRRGLPCHDFGFLVAVFFPVSLLWYAFWSRGRRGLLTLAALLGLMYLPWISAVAVWLILYGFA